MVESAHTWKLFAFEEFAGSATAGAHECDLVAVASHLDGLHGVAATDDRASVGIRNCLSDCEGACVAGFDFEDAHRSVPENSLGILNFCIEELDALRADVDAFPAIFDTAFNHFAIGKSARAEIEAFTCVTPISSALGVRATRI